LQVQKCNLFSVTLNDVDRQTENTLRKKTKVQSGTQCDAGTEKGDPGESAGDESQELRVAVKQFEDPKTRKYEKNRKQALDTGSFNNNLTNTRRKAGH